jgi:4-amino-4-deoxy-L-arabinose transferase-like glycosyltransferase
MQTTRPRQTSPNQAQIQWLRAVQWVDARPGAALIAILLLALILNVTHLWAFPPSLEERQANDWWAPVHNLLQGRGYTDCSPNYFPFCASTNQVTAAREPLPVLIFTLIAWLTQESAWPVAAAEVIFNLATLLVVFRLARALADNRAALAAALLWAVHLPVVVDTGQISGDMLAALTIACGFFLFTRAQQTNRARDWAAAGVCVGLGALSRSGALAVALPLAAGLGLARWDRARPIWSALREAARPVTLFSLAVFLAISPWMVRNFLAFGRPVIGSTLLGYNLYRHNSILSGDDYLRFVGPVEGRQNIQTLLARHPELQGTENEAQMDGFYRSEAMRIIAQYPARYVLAVAYRSLPLWFDWGVREAYGAAPGALAYLAMFQQGVLLVLAILGLWRTRWRTWPLWSSVAALSLTYMAVGARLRYLIPVMSLIVVLSAIGGVYAIRTLAGRRNHWEH